MHVRTEAGARLVLKLAHLDDGRDDDFIGWSGGDAAYLGCRVLREINVLPSSGGRLFLALAHLDDGRDELQQEAVDLEEGGVEVVQKVHDEALDVGAVVVLVGHDHQVPVAQLLRAVVHLHVMPLVCHTCAPVIGQCNHLCIGE